MIFFEKTSNPWIELGNDLIDVSPTWGTGLENNFWRGKWFFGIWALIKKVSDEVFALYLCKNFVINMYCNIFG